MRKIIFWMGLFFVLPVKAFFVLGTECPLEQPIMWIDKKCYACDEARTLIANSSEEQRYSSLVTNALDELEMFCKCPADKPILGRDGQCYTCDEARAKISERNAEDIHGGDVFKVISDIDELCAPKCSADKPAVWTDSKCYACSEIEQKLQSMSSSFNGIAGFHMIGVLMDIANACPELQSEEMKQTENEAISISKSTECTEAEPLLGLDGRCHTCDETEVFGMSADTIEQCEKVCNGENGISKRYREGYYCMPRICPTDKPLMSTKGVCYSCEELPKDEDIVTGCLSCPNCSMSTAWFDVNGMAGISCKKKSEDFFYEEKKDYEYRDLIQNMKIQCPVDKPILTNKGECVNCFVSRDIQSLKGCDLCPNRKIEGRANSHGAYLDCVWKEEE